MSILALRHVPGPLPSGIYILRCGETVYIGQSVNVPARLIHHRSALKTGKHFNRALQTAYNTHGLSFCQQLARCSYVDLDRMERGVIQIMPKHCLANRTTGGGSAIRLYAASVATRALISTNTRKQMSSQLARDTISKAQSKPVINLDTGEAFSSATAAAASLGRHSDFVSMAIRKGIRAASFRWAFVGEKAPNFGKASRVGITNTATKKHYTTITEACRVEGYTQSTIRTAIKEGKFHVDS